MGGFSRKLPGLTVTAMADKSLYEMPVDETACWTTFSMFCLWRSWANGGMMPPLLE